MQFNQIIDFLMSIIFGNINENVCGVFDLWSIGWASIVIQIFYSQRHSSINQSHIGLLISKIKVSECRMQ